MNPDPNPTGIPWSYVLSITILTVLLTACASGGSGGPFDVAVAVDGDGSVTSEPAGIDCPDTCAGSFPDGADVTLTAIPDVGASFGGWGGDCSGSSATCTLEVTADLSADASFSAESGSDGLEASLNELGVDTTRSERVGPDGEPLPDSFAPLGTSASYGDAEEFSDDSSMNATDELFVYGTHLPDVPGDSSITLLELKGVQVATDGSIDPGTAQTLHSMPDADNTWSEVSPDDGGDPTSLRAATAGDVDGDGYEEVVVVFVEGNALRVKVVDDAEAGHAEAEHIVDAADDVLDVAVITADLDGDGSADLVVGASDASGTDMLFLVDGATGYTIDDTRTKRLDATLSGSQVTVELTSGNVDFDAPEELAIVMNELGAEEGPSDPPEGVTRYALYDDGTAGLAELDAGPVQTTDGTLLTALAADVDMGDVDGDGLDEVAFGGLTEFNTQCGHVEGMAMVLDDAHGEFETLSGGRPVVTFSKCAPAYEDYIHYALLLRSLPVHAVDLDGDGVDEVQVGQHLFADAGSSDAFDEATYTIPDSYFVVETSPLSYTEVPVTTNWLASASGDVTGDGRENVLVFPSYKTPSLGEPGQVQVWGQSAIDAVGFDLLSRLTADLAFAPGLVPVNVDDDGPILKYAAGEHRLVFTEPIVTAALAAAPCAEDIGQNLSACATAFGDAESTTESREVTVSNSVSAYVGVKLGGDVPAIGEATAELKQSVTRTASLTTGRAYTLEKSRVFTTGPLEDAIVFTSIPFDVYRYDIMAHPDPDMVGGTVEVHSPREPVILKAERTFFNARLDDAEPIGANVFDHTVGDLSSYPSESRKAALLAEFGGLENGPLTVGQGTGSEGLGIAVGEEVSVGGSLGIEFETSVDAAAGPEGVVALAGFSVGYGIESSLTLTSGSETRYDVTVGDLSAATFSEHQYAFGMFTYVQEVDGREFEVINYWVE